MTDNVKETTKYHTDAVYRCRITSEKKNYYLLRLAAVLKNNGDRKTLFIPRNEMYLNKQDAIIVDIRSEEEFKKGHIVNAKNITLSQIEKGTFPAIENNKQSPIIVVCESGTRSSSAAAKLVKAEFTQVTSLFSGMGGWKSANLPTTKK